MAAGDSRRRRDDRNGTHQHRRRRSGACHRLFCTAAFGLTVGRKLGPAITELLGAGAPIYLLEKAAGSAAGPATDDRRRYARHWTPVHLDFVVADLDAALKAALAAGATLEAPAAVHVWGKIAHLADPFGHGVCLVQFLGRGYDEIATG